MPTPKAPRLLILGGGAVASEFYIPAVATLGCLDKAVVVDASPSTAKALRDKYNQVSVRQGDFRTFHRPTRTDSLPRPSPP